MLTRRAGEHECARPCSENKPGWSQLTASPLRSPGAEKWPPAPIQTVQTERKVNSQAAPLLGGRGWAQLWRKGF